MSHVEFTKVTKSFGAVEVIPPLDLTISEGEFVVLVGPSGCGKTTTLRMLAGLETVSTGSIAIAGRDVTTADPGDRDCAMVFQNYALYPHMTVEENISYAMRVHGIDASEIKRRVTEAVTILGLEDYIDRKPRNLSGGQRQRVAIGRALVRQPQVFLFDEPLSNLDAKLRVEMRTEIRQLQRKLGTTAVYVTHDQVEAMTMGDRIAVLRPLAGGTVQTTSLQQCATPRQLYNEPNNVFVAGFIGSPSMNFFDATVVKEDGNMMVDTGDFRVAIPADRQKAYQGYVGKKVMFGLRPDHLYAPEYAPPITNKAFVKGIIEVVELLGHELHVYVKSGAQTYVATIDIRSHARVGDAIELVADMDNMHLFDPDTELRIA